MVSEPMLLLGLLVILFLYGITHCSIAFLVFSYLGQYLCVFIPIVASVYYLLSTGDVTKCGSAIVY